MMSEEDVGGAAAGAGSGDYQKGGGLAGLQRAETIALGMNPDDKRIVRRKLPYYDAASFLVGVGVPGAQEVIKSVTGEDVTLVGPTLSEIIYQKGNGPALAQELRSVLNLPETGNAGVSRAGKLAYLLCLLATGKATNPKPGFGPLMGGASTAGNENAAAIGLEFSDMTSLLKYMEPSAIIDSFQKLLAAKFPGNR